MSCIPRDKLAVEAPTLAASFQSLPREEDSIGWQRCRAPFTEQGSRSLTVHNPRNGIAHQLFGMSLFRSYPTRGAWLLRDNFRFCSASGSGICELYWKKKWFARCHCRTIVVPQNCSQILQEVERAWKTTLFTFLNKRFKKNMYTSVLPGACI